MNFTINKRMLKSNSYFPTSFHTYIYICSVVKANLLIFFCFAYPTNPKISIGTPNMIYAKKNKVPTKYRIAATNAVAIAPPIASAESSAFAVEPKNMKLNIQHMPLLKL